MAERWKHFWDATQMPPYCIVFASFFSYIFFFFFHFCWFSRVLSHFNCNLLFNFVSASLVQLIIKLNCSVNMKKRRRRRRGKKRIGNAQANINTWCALNYANGLFCHSFKLSETRKWRSAFRVAARNKNISQFRFVFVLVFFFATEMKITEWKKGKTLFFSLMRVLMGRNAVKMHTFSLFCQHMHFVIAFHPINEHSLRSQWDMEQQKKKKWSSQMCFAYRLVERVRLHLPPSKVVYFSGHPLHECQAKLSLNLSQWISELSYKSNWKSSFWHTVTVKI